MRNTAIYLTGGEVIRLLLTGQEADSLRTMMRQRPVHTASHLVEMDTESGSRLQLDLMHVTGVLDEDVTRVAERAQALMELMDP